MGVVLAENSYGKSGVRLIRIARQPDRDVLKDLTVNLELRGDFSAAHTTGDNRNILHTDTLQNAVYALAKSDPTETGEEPIEELALRLGDYFLDNSPHLSEARIEVAEAQWSRIILGGKPHMHAFTRNGGEKRVALVTAARDSTTIEAGIDGLAVLKTAGAGLGGFQPDPFSAPGANSERVLATAVKARWLYRGRDAAFGPCWHGVRQIILETFAQHDTRSVQHALYAMGESVLESFDDVTEIRFTLPNHPCRPVDLSRFGLENNDEVFSPADEPQGVIEATIRKKP